MAITTGKEEAQPMAQERKPARKRIKVTIVAEGYNEDLNEILEQGLTLAKARVMGMSLGSKKAGGPTLAVSTTRSRGDARLRP